VDGIDFALVVTMRSKLLLACAALLAAAACATYSSADAPSHASDGRSFALRDVGLPMENVAQLDAGVWRGSEPGPVGLRALKAAGFRSIVDLRAGGDERREAEALGLKVIEVPIHASITCDPPSPEQVREFLDAVTDPRNQPVYVHCIHGRDRTGLMCAVYRMEVCGWTREEATEEMHAFGFRSWYRDFVSFLGGYECSGKYTREQSETR
jgi:tyrosine-protein phosphatase SIW14